jgi:superfamily II DNA or RNA helicase
MSKIANEIKDEIQRTAHLIWRKMGRRGTIAAGTGFGKSRVAVMEVVRMVKAEMLSAISTGEEKPILLVVPTTKLRDENWPEEFRNWGVEPLFNDYIKSICFASLKKEKGSKYQLVILDEIHRLTELSARAFEAGDEDEDVLTSFMAESLSEAVMGLTATVPNPKTEPDKHRIISQIAPVVFSYTLDQGVADGMIADYEIRCIEAELDDTQKVYPGGTKKKPFMTTEKRAYDYLENQIKRYRGLAHSAPIFKDKQKFEKLVMIRTMERNRFVASCNTKSDVARRCMKQVVASGKRAVIFCGSIAQANELGGKNVYHSKSGDEAYLAFNRGEIDYICVVNAVNEGVNLFNVDVLLILQVNSNERDFIQRLGRALRIREGHKALVYVVFIRNTADERWLEKSMANLDKSKISKFQAKMVPA